MAKKSKKSTVEADQAPPKSAEEVFQEHFPLISQAAADMDAATQEAATKRGIYRAALKAFTKAGGDLDALTAALKDRKIEPEEVTRRLRNYNNYTRWMGLAIGTQAGLFDDGESVATKSENDKAAANGSKPHTRRDKTLSQIKKEGAAASAAGKFETACEYEEGTPEFLAWQGGFRADTKKRVHAMGSKAKNGAASAEAHPTA